MKKILATILVLGFVVPVFAKAQNTQQRKEKIEVMKEVINTSLYKINEYTYKLCSITKSGDFVKGFITGIVSTFATIAIINSIKIIGYYKPLISK
jgi:hypothetical protein